MIQQASVPERKPSDSPQGGGYASVGPRSLRLFFHSESPNSNHHPPSTIHIPHISTRMRDTLSLQNCNRGSPGTLLHPFRPSCCLASRQYRSSNLGLLTPDTQPIAPLFHLPRLARYTQADPHIQVKNNILRNETHDREQCSVAIHWAPKRRGVRRSGEVGKSVDGTDNEQRHGKRCVRKGLSNALPLALSLSHTHSLITLEAGKEEGRLGRTFFVYGISFSESRQMRSRMKIITTRIMANTALPATVRYLPSGSCARPPPALISVAATMNPRRASFVIRTGSSFSCRLSVSLW